MIASNEDLHGSAIPSGPIPNPCLSYWQRTTRAFPHLYTNRNADIPKESPYVIIGSGISGALTAFELTENGVNGKDIIILEAREAASGASSRNAGHVRPGMNPTFNCRNISILTYQMRSGASSITHHFMAPNKP